jgi:transcription elongation factor SPT6
MPKIFALSVGKIDENKFPGLVLQAISIARLIQDPLLCYSQLWNINRDILSLKLHPMQNEIITMSGSRNSKDATELLQMLEIEFINAVNFVGVDLNRCNKSAHTANCLQFVCGLGPCTAHFKSINTTPN